MQYTAVYFNCLQWWFEIRHFRSEKFLCVMRSTGRFEE